MDYRAVAVQAALKAGEIHKKYFGKSYSVRPKGVSFDLLTSADTEAEKAVVALIRKKFPGHNFLAEENRYPRTDSGYTWVIDPLDGTNNFACGIPVFCSSVALIHDNTVVAGAVYDVMRNELFCAAKNKGAFLNGKRIRVNAAHAFTKSLLITGFYYSRGKEMEETLEAIKRFFLRRVLGIRRFGAAALDLSYVACGRAAGFWEFELSPWDFCAGKLLIEEAGGRVTGKTGESIPLMQKGFIVASNGTIHRRMLGILNE
ncbi:MAG: inositol monophosphatase family protein [Candidatus Omnitrophota bacterium]|jgi:myo-inositol-1(or 4)-monophosphatase